MGANRPQASVGKLKHAPPWQVAVVGHALACPACSGISWHAVRAPYQGQGLPPPCPPALPPTANRPTAPTGKARRAPFRDGQVNHLLSATDARFSGPHNPDAVHLVDALSTLWTQP